MHSFLISPEALQAQLHNPKLIILDVRANLKDPHAGLEAFKKAHIPGARLAQMATDVSGPCTGSNGRNPFPDINQFCIRMQALGVCNDSTVVIYDDGPCNFAARLWFTFRCAGFENVRVLDGGLKAWLTIDGPMSEEIVSVEPGDMTQRASLERVFALSEVIENMTTQHYALVDGRGHSRYLGQNETLDRVGGHIPGAMSRPSTQNLGENGRFKSPEQLRSEFKPYFNRFPGRDVMNTCGSGVTACCNHLAMKIAGLSPVGVYIGSWSEWVSDPSRPISTVDE